MQFDIIRPSDFHAHLRDDSFITPLAVSHSKKFANVLVMPNLVPPITTCKMANDYIARLEKFDDKINFMPTLYLTETTSSEELRLAKTLNVAGVKLYPAGATTNSDSGVSDIKKVYPLLAVMEEIGLPLLIHGEVVDSDVDIFTREKKFIDKTLTKIRAKFPRLQIVFEHITTKNAAQFVQDNEHIFATITAHHLLFDRNAMLAGGIRPHFYCLPILKHKKHREYLLEVATSGSSKFFAGTDSAPHLRSKKEASCGCAGSYTAYHAIELYAKAFDDYLDLSKSKTQKNFELFMSINGCNFYGLPIPEERITLKKSPLKIPENFGEIIPLLAGEEISWSA
jgi:dihydroorotase